MSKSKMQKTTADAAVNHPNACSSWLKPAAAIEAAINSWQMVSKPTVAPSPSFLPPSSAHLLSYEKTTAPGNVNSPGAVC